MEENSQVSCTGEGKGGLEDMLHQRSFSRIGRLNKNSQTVAIRHLANEGNFTRDYKRKLAFKEASKLAYQEVDNN